MSGGVNVDYQSIFATAYALFKAGRWSYERYQEWKRKYEEASRLAGYGFPRPEIAEKRLREEVLISRPLPARPIREERGKGGSADMASSRRYRSVRRQGTCDIPAKYFDTVGSSASGSTITGAGTGTQWANGILSVLTSPGANPTWLWPTNVLQSDDGNGRVGNTICLESFYHRITIAPSTTGLSAGTSSHLRLLLVADTEGQSTAPALSDVLMTSTIAAGAFEAPLNVSNFGRFKVIKDKVITLYSPSSTANEGDLTFEEFIPMKGHVVNWDSDNTTRGPGHLWYFLLYKENLPVGSGTPANAGTNVITTANPPGLSVYTRIRYKD